MSEMTWRQWRELLAEADRRMKANRGHSFIHILKVRCQYCGRSPKQKGVCRRWFDTFCDELFRVVSESPVSAGADGTGPGA